MTPATPTLRMAHPPSRPSPQKATDARTAPSPNASRPVAQMRHPKLMKRQHLSPVEKLLGATT